MQDRVARRYRFGPPALLFPLFLPLFLISACATVNKVEDAQAAFARGEADVAAGKFKEAIERFSEAIALHPKMEAAYYKRGACRLTIVSNDESKNPRLDLQEAIKDFNRSIALWPLNHDSFYDRGVCYATLAMYREAVKDFQAVLRSSDPDLLKRAHRKLGLIYQDEYEDMKVEALEHYGKYMELGGEDPDIAKRIKGLRDSDPKGVGGR
ncbi:MAG TPA: tetratricopeptide repeat protein [Planctomycetota bacterium]|nr:tetratricopeptide repeat protein [Planctomycetota bacterium]